MGGRYRAEQVGSLLRPPALAAAREAVSRGRMRLDDLRAAEDLAIREALERQREIGLDVVTDGEMRRSSWLAEMAEAVEGFTDERVLLDWKGPGAASEPTRARVAGAALRRRRPLSVHEVPFLAREAGAPYKVTLPAPSNFMFASYKVGVTDRVYPTRAAFVDAVARIVSDEVRWLLDQGVGYIQLDAPYYSHYLDPRQRARMVGLGIAPDEALEVAMAADNLALGAIPQGRRDQVTTALHVCRGNNRSRWYTEGAYDAIAGRLFATLDVNRFLLEYDDERSGSFAPLRLLPPGKTAVLGLVTTKSPALEPQEVLVRRIDEAARHVPLAQLALSPQCGFASTAAGNLLSEDDQWRKLELVARMARKVWGSEST